MGRRHEEQRAGDGRSRRGTLIALTLAAMAAALALAAAAWRSVPAAPAQLAAEAELAFDASDLVEPAESVLAATLEISGPLVAPGTAVVRARLAGHVALAVAEGDRVRAGQPLGRIVPADADAREAEREASLAAARLQAEQAERQHDSSAALAAQGFVSPTALDAARIARDAARARVAEAQAQREAQRAPQRLLQPVAPIGGWVAKRHVLPGEQVAAEQPLLTIVDLARLELAGAVGTHEVGRLRPGLAVEVQIEGEGAPRHGVLQRIAPAAEAGARAIGVVVALPNPGERLRAGQFAVGRVRLDDAAPRPSLPIDAVLEADGTPQVWTISDGRLQRRTVRLGRRDEAAGRVELLAGLPPGAPVLAHPLQTLREGARARIASAPVEPGRVLR